MEDEEEKVIREIKEALGNPEGCEILYNEAIRTYTVTPQENQKDIRISVINNVIHDNNSIHLFQAFSFIFEKCVFESEISFKNQTFNCGIRFEKCIFREKVCVEDTTFEEILDCIDSTFELEVDFSRSDFKGGVSFTSSIFEQNTCFGSVAFHNSLIDSAESSQENSNYVANFSDAKFKKDADFFNSTFHQQAKFSGTIFDDYATFNSAKFLSKADFMGTHFKGGASFTSSVFEQYACFIGVTFHDDANFDHAEFQIKENSQGIADFSGAHFKERAELRSIFGHNAYFHGAIFDHNAYFDGAEFKQEANFSQSEFYKNAHFYKTKFKELPKENVQEEDIPNFLQAIFNGSINLTDTPLFLFDFKDLESIIKDSHKANEFRDTFKNIKNALIKDNNLLDASRFHKMELYAKELELEYKKKEEPQNSTTRDFVDRIQLMFYRMASDHHTDLLLILNNVLALIVLFGGFAYGLFCCASYETITENSVTKKVYYLYSLTTDSFCVGCNIWNVFCIETFLIISLCCVFVAAFILLIFFFNYVNTICRELGYWFIAFFVLNLFILAIKPALILPIFGKLIDESLKIDFPAFTSLSIVYAILMFLLIFSLQKTARKNTIVPS